MQGIDTFNEAGFSSLRNQIDRAIQLMTIIHNFGHWGTLLWGYQGKTYGQRNIRAHEIHELSGQRTQTIYGWTGLCPRERAPGGAAFYQGKQQAETIKTKAKQELSVQGKCPDKKAVST